MWLKANMNDEPMFVEQGILDYALCENGNGTVLSFFNLSIVSSAEIYFHATVLSGIIVFGLCANAMVLLLVACDKRLRYRSTFAALNIVLVDFLLTIFYHGVALTSLFQKEWAYGMDDVEVCRFYSFMSPYFIYVRWIALSLICVDRFLTVRFPFHYERHKKLLLLALTALVWCIPVLFGMALLLVGTPTFRTNVPTCLVSCVNKNSRLCGALAILLFTFTFIIGGLIPSILYTWMYRKGRALRPKLVMGTFSAHTVATAVAGTNITPQSSNEVSRERRTLTTLILLYLTVLLTSIPQYLLIFLRGVYICAFFKIPISVHFIVSDIFFLSTALDPIVLMRTQDFRRAFRQLFYKRRKQHHLPSSVSNSPSPGLSIEDTSL